jgi:hypothetical protein
MNRQALEQAVALAQRVGHVLIATVGAGPHVAAAGKVALLPGGLLSVTEWFCPGTLANLDADNRVAVVAWDAAADRGFQVIGRVEQAENLAVMDGYSPELAGRPAPLAQWQLAIRPERILDFTRAPHTDVEE